MSKPKPSPSFNTYSLTRKDSGYFITRHTVQNGAVVASEKVSEPDMLVITIANLEKLVRKDLGL